jgi:CBS-domain-containing membrane protein
VHRCPVVENGVVVGVVSQSTLISFLARSLHGKAMQQLQIPLAQLHIITASPRTIQRSAVVGDAFRLMHDLAIDSLPVVDAENHVTGSLSISCLRGVSSASDFKSLLEMTVGDFLSHNREDLSKGISFKQSGTLAEALLVITSHRCHRLNIVDDAGVFCGLVTLGDVVRALLVALSGTTPARRETIHQ